MENEKKIDVNKTQNLKSTKSENTKEYLKNIIDDILSQMVKTNEETSNTSPISDINCNIDIELLTKNVTNINILKFELDRLPLDFKTRAYFENDVKPLVDTLTILAYSAANFSVTATNIAGTNFGHASKIKESLGLVDEINEMSEELIEVLQCKIHNMIKFSKYDI